METLAHAAGVSKSTVSRALKNSDEVSDKVKARIRRLAYESDYRLTGSAWEWSGKRSPTVSVVLPTSATRSELYSSPFTLEMMGVIADALADNGYNMLLTKADLSEPDAARTILSKGASDGIILIGQRGDHARIKSLARTAPNVVIWGAVLPDADYCTIGSDNRDGGKTAAEHLIRHGRRRIAFLGDRRAIEAKLRFFGYRDAIAKSAIFFHDELVIDTQFDRAAAMSAVGAALDDGLNIDAIFAANDLLALSAMHALQERGANIPDDVAVIGFDDIPIAEYAMPPLTTIRQNIVEGGNTIVRSLMKIISGEGAASKMMPAELIIRQSCGAGPI